MHAAETSAVSSPFRQRKRVLLDTNFLLESLGNRVSITSELHRILPGAKPTILEETHEELRMLATRDRTKTAQLAKLVLAYLKAGDYVMIPASGEKIGVDDRLVALGKEAPRTTYVATMDLPLRRRLKEALVPQVVLRQRQYLQVIET